jgi:hypothetical protein
VLTQNGQLCVKTTPRRSGKRVITSLSFFVVPIGKNY